MANEIKKRALGNTGIEISELGFGAWPLAGLGRGSAYGAITEDEAFALLNTYVEAGGNYIDTARSYNNSELAVGQYLKKQGNRDKLIISTKTLGGSTADNLDDIDSHIETSLTNLGTDYIDLYFLHWPPEEPEVMEIALGKLERFKEQGKIRAIGASIKGPNVTQMSVDLCQAYMDTGKVEALMVVYSILRQANLPVIEDAKSRGIGIIVRTVLESGLLTGAYSVGHTFPETDHRSRYDRTKLDYVLKANDELNGFAVQAPYTSLAQAAFRFSLTASGLSSIIMGVQNTNEIKLNLDTLALPPLSDEVVSEIKERYGKLTDMANFDSESGFAR